MSAEQAARLSKPRPSVGRIVHYVSYGTPGGEFASEHRAAIIAAVGYHSARAEEPVPDDTVDLVVFNPQGLFFNTCPHDEETKKGGTWHWPERVEESAPLRPHSTGREVTLSEEMPGS